MKPYCIFLLSFLLLSGCVETQQPETTVTQSTNGITTISQPTVLPSTDPEIQQAEPYISKIVFSDFDLRTQATSAISSCLPQDKECQINQIYRYVVENYQYYSDPRTAQIIQTPKQTNQIKGGDCEDLSILLNSLLENVGIETYMVLTPTHAYSLACDVNVNNLLLEVKKSNKTQFMKAVAGQDRNVLFENGNIFLYKEYHEKTFLKPRDTYFWGGDGNKLDYPFLFENLEYTVSSDQPLTVKVLPSKSQWDLFIKGEQYSDIPSCAHERVLQDTFSCDNLSTDSGIMLFNEFQETPVSLDATIYWAYSPNAIPQDENIHWYQLNGKTCVVLDPTAGVWGYPGFDANVTGEKIAIDPQTKEYTRLN